jgi:hypothetical protein
LPLSLHGSRKSNVAIADRLAGLSNIKSNSTSRAPSRGQFAPGVAREYRRSNG